MTQATGAMLSDAARALNKDPAHATSAAQLLASSGAVASVGGTTMACGFMDMPGLQIRDS